MLWLGAWASEQVKDTQRLAIRERTAKRTWAYARAWLHEELKKTL